MRFMIRAVFIPVYVLVLAIVFMSGPALAQDSLSGFSTSVNPDQSEPLEIMADDSLVWLRNEKIFKANRNVRAKQGDTTLSSNILTAKYREKQEDGMEIYNILAEGGVVIDSHTSQAYGDRAEYDVDKGVAVMTGHDLRLVSPDQTVTAQDKFEYWVVKGMLVAVGNAVAVRQGDRLEADRILASFTEDSKGARTLKQLEAENNVKITTPTEVLTGNYAIYHSDTNLAEVTGNVKIVRGPNVLEGEKAEVDLNTNISKMFGSKGGGGRVRGVFYPSSQKKSDKTGNLE